MPPAVVTPLLLNAAWQNSENVFAGSFDNVWVRRFASVLVVGAFTALGFFAAPAVILIVLGLVGFGTLGPIAGSIAAGIQSGFAGGAVASGSLFAFLQTVAMGGALVVAMQFVGAIIGAALGIDMVATFRCFFGWAAGTQCGGY